MRDKGLDPETDLATRTDFVRWVTLQLNDMVRKRKVEKIGRGRATLWRLRADRPYGVGILCKNRETAVI
jgi:hypothetical protein